MKKKSGPEIQIWLVQQIAQHLKINESDISVTGNIQSFGLDSLQLTIMVGDLELWLSCSDIHPQVFLQANNLEELATNLAHSIEANTSDNSPMNAVPENTKANIDNLNLDQIFKMGACSLASRIQASSLAVNMTLESGIYARKILSQNDRVVQVFDPLTKKPKQMIMMGSNNYLGLACHPDVKARAKRAIDDFGTGMSGPYLLSGMTSLHEELEHRLAKLKGAEASLIYATGYQTNIGWVVGLVRDGDVMVYDELSHASFYDALMMAKAYYPRLQTYAFKHNDVNHLNQILSGISQRNSVSRGQIFVAVEGVYSMEGDLAPLPAIRRACDQHDALLAVDDAHGTLVLGEHGGGAAEYFGMKDKVDISIGTFSKSFTSTGGFVAAKKEIIDYLRIFSRAHMFSAHLAPPTTGTILGCLDVVEKEPQRIKTLHKNVAYLVSELNRIGISIKGECPILPILIPAEIEIKEMAKRVHEEGVFVNPVMHPAVPKDQQRLRLNVMATHTREDLNRVVTVLEEVGIEFGMLHKKSA